MFTNIKSVSIYESALDYIQSVKTPLYSSIKMHMLRHCLLFLGSFGNILTLVAIPYVRRKKGPQFSILQMNSVVLILHLSLADLLFSVLSIPIGLGTEIMKLLERILYSNF